MDDWRWHSGSQTRKFLSRRSPRCDQLQPRVRAVRILDASAYYIVASKLSSKSLHERYNGGDIFLYCRPCDKHRRRRRRAQGSCGGMLWHGSEMSLWASSSGPEGTLGGLVQALTLKIKWCSGFGAPSHWWSTKATLFIKVLISLEIFFHTIIVYFSYHGIIKELYS